MVRVTLSVVGIFWMHAVATVAVAQLNSIDEPKRVNSAEVTQSSASQGPRGGQLQQVGSIQIETVLEHSGIRAFVYDDLMRPVNVSGSRGLATLKFAGDPRRYRYDLFADASRGERGPSLSAAVDLSRFAGRDVEVELRIVGLPERGEESVVLRDVAKVPMSKEQLVAAAIAQQEICPVSGQPLGSMGAPIAVQVGDQTVYVCCQGCVDAVKANSPKFAKDNRPMGGP